jgi:hypothetical protein
MLRFSLTIDLKGPCQTEKDVAAVLNDLSYALARETWCFGTSEDDPEGVPPVTLRRDDRPIGSWSVQEGPA